MPIYEYYCSTCDVKFDTMRPMSQADVQAFCPDCHSEAKRVISLFIALSQTADGVVSSVSGFSQGCPGCSGGYCANCGAL